MVYMRVGERARRDIDIARRNMRWWWQWLQYVNCGEMKLVDRYRGDRCQFTQQGDVNYKVLGVIFNVQIGCAENRPLHLNAD
jgi:hypothetical protein